MSELANDWFRFRINGTWKVGHVLEARERLEQIPAKYHSEAVEMMAEPGISARDGLWMLANLGALSGDLQAETFSLFRSTDERKRSRAIARARNVPPVPGLWAKWKALRLDLKELSQSVFGPEIEAEIRNAEAACVSHGKRWREQWESGEVSA